MPGEIDKGAFFLFRRRYGFLIPVEIIRKKRDGYKLSKEEISYFINGYVNGEVADYQASAWCMAVFFRGMEKDEILSLVEVVGRSGDVLDLNDFSEPKLDKHSTGGVGDKVSLVLVPLMASCGFLFPKMSGRGLGHSGGTIDKIESIPGFRTALSLDEFKDVLKKVGAVIAGQTANLAPADKKLYALRDVTATVESIPLIVSSILGKKIASGTDVWVFDVKVGKGAFMKEMDSARELARLLVSISKEMGKKAAALITDMNQPLGRKVGNSLEVEEAIETLRGEGPPDLTKVVLSLGARLSSLAGSPISEEDLIKKLLDGSALEKFREIVEAQGGNPEVIDNTNLLEHAPYKFVLEAEKDGVISSLDAERIGMAVVMLGGGRKRKEDEIDRGVGVVLLKKEGDSVEKGEPLAEIFYRSRESLEEALRLVKMAYEIDSFYKKRSLIYEELV